VINVAVLACVLRFWGRRQKKRSQLFQGKKCTPRKNSGHPYD